MRYFKKICGQTVYLSPVNPADCEQYTAWVNDPAVSTHLGQHASLYSLSSERSTLESMAANGYNFAIVRLSDDQLLGNISFCDLHQRNQRAECGLFIGEAENRGKGYGTEALRLLLDYGFNTLNLRNVMLRCYATNEQGIACYRKVGFKEIGRRRQALYVNGVFIDDVYMDILKEEFTANNCQS